MSFGMPFSQPHAVTQLINNTFASCELRREGEVTDVSVEREIRDIFSQGDTGFRAPSNSEECVAMIRETGFRGHEGFLKTFSRHLLRALRGRFAPRRRQGVAWACLLVGGRGIGKSTLLKIASKMVAGSARKVLEIQCSSYQKEHALQSLVGSPMSYVGYGEGGVLQNFVKQHPDGVLLFNKPELSHPVLLNLIREILSGAFTAGDGQVISTRRLTVFMTSNAGCDPGRTRIGFGPGGDKREEKVREALEELLQPDLMGTLGPGNIFCMDALEPAALRNIFRLAAAGYGAAQGVEIQMDEGVVEKVVEESDTHLHGAKAVLARYHAFVEPLLDEELERSPGLGWRGRIEKLHVFLDQDDNIACRAVHRASATGALSGKIGEVACR
jgi:ATP-dependent Clp protease ATP-binding subunit ClpA